MHNSIENIEADNSVLFELPLDLELVKSEQGNRRIVRGYASTEAVDQDGEIILKHGIDFSYLLKSGFLNYDHQYREIAGVRMPVIVGYPTKAEVRDKGLWVEGELLKSTGETQSEQTRLADELWELGLAFQKSGGLRKLSFSVEGNKIETHGNKIVKSVVRHLAITTKPVNTEATIDVFRKSMCCGKCNKNHPLYIGGHSCGSHGNVDTPELVKAMTTESAAPLMLENLDYGISTSLYGYDDIKNIKCECVNPFGKFTRGTFGAAQHMHKCLGYKQAQSLTFLKALINTATDKPHILQFLKSAGLV